MSIVDGTGAVVAEYEYDPYGNIISTTGELAEVNPLRYRGYGYDQESNLYYLQSRYYDPSIGRFLNADSYASTGQGILGNNMFAYCGNNPVFRVDPHGQAWYEYVWELAKEIIRWGIHAGHDALAATGVDTAGIGAGLLDMYESSPGVYHARTDCWQQYFGYNSMYDFVFDAGTSMATNQFEFTHNGTSYVIWVWKGDYINLGAGAEMGIYYGGGPHWLIDTGLSMPMTLTLSYKGKQIINHTQETWWITGFNSNHRNVQASALSATFTIDFSRFPGMYNSFYKAYSNTPGWSFNMLNYTATYSF